MALWTNQGLIDSTRAFLASGAVPSYTVLLFVNDHVPSPISVPADLVECSLPGYARAPLSPASWTLSVAAGLVTAIYPTLTFSFGSNSGGTVIYGFMVVNTTGGAERSAWGERFAYPYGVPSAGGSLTLDLSDYEQAR